MICVRTPSRLHFGLLNFVPEADGPDRLFGSAGLMIREPGVILEARQSATWSADGPLAGRALAFARQLASTFPPGSLRPQHLHVERAAPEHAGLGTGTQLGLAVASALSLAAGLPELTPEELAERIGRGKRSGLGVHGFARGGFLVDGGKRGPGGVAPLVARVDFPEAWRVVLVLPPGQPGLHGEGEGRAFEQLREGNTSPGLTDRLCRLVLLGMLPALIERDLDAFGDAVYEFNRRVGEVFAPVQGGPYAHPGTEEIVEFVRRQKVWGVGQSSWGPAVFAVVGDGERADRLAGGLRVRFGLQEPEVFVSPACNKGTIIEKGQ